MYSMMRDTIASKPSRGMLEVKLGAARASECSGIGSGRASRQRTSAIVSEAWR